MLQDRTADSGAQAAAGQEYRRRPRRSRKPIPAQHTFLTHDLLLIVEDDGVGFYGKDLEHLFAQAPNGNRRAMSTGLGLANVKRRLQTLYGPQATMLVERPSQSECRVTLGIPL